ncbi:MAG: hypothetical protein HY814_12385, partial [Candidatus Riflebacteria bacterium]|nr:hypothetical protein [Candidatus Riflebacteria bacterium]
PVPLNGSEPIPLTTTAYTDSAVVNLQTYFYAIAAVDASGNESDPSAPVSATPTGVDLAVGVEPLLQDIVFFPANPTVFDTGTLTVVAHNLGTDAYGPVAVNFYDGPPETGTLLGSAAIQNIEGGNGVGTASIELSLISMQGGHTFFAVLDPDNQVAEIDETNNTVSTTVNVTLDRGINLKAAKLDPKDFPVVKAHLRAEDMGGHGLRGAGAWRGPAEAGHQVGAGPDRHV